jgi:hypothetical protein
VPAWAVNDAAASAAVAMKVLTLYMVDCDFTKSRATDGINGGADAIAESVLTIAMSR